MDYERNDFLFMLFEIVARILYFFSKEYRGLLKYHLLPSQKLKWSRMFSIMENAKHSLPIEDYSITQTTFEQVFLSFTQHQRNSREISRGYDERLGTLDELVDLSFVGKYRFPKNKLDLGMELGYGHFGVVHEGFAYGIVTDEPQTKVAVKKVKENAPDEVRCIFILLKSK